MKWIRESLSKLLYGQSELMLLLDVGLIAMGLVLGSAWLLTYVEPKTFPTYLDAVWFTTATVTTVGFGDITPVTVPGRAIGIFLMVVGIGVVITFMGIMSNIILGSLKDRRSFDTRRQQRRLQGSVKDVQQQMAEMSERMLRMEAMLAKLTGEEVEKAGTGNGTTNTSRDGKKGDKRSG